MVQRGYMTKRFEQHPSVAFTSYISSKNGQIKITVQHDQPQFVPNNPIKFKQNLSSSDRGVESTKCHYSVL